VGRKDRPGATRRPGAPIPSAHRPSPGRSRPPLFALLLLGVAAVVALVFAFRGGASRTRILFIGNSYVGVNELPEIVRKVISSAGLAEPTVASRTPGGFTLWQHLHDAATLAAIDEGSWSVVVLQEQSQAPALADKYVNARQEFLDGAVGLCDRIKRKSPSARVVLFETWARHADLWSRAPRDVVELGSNPDEMQARIRTWYDNAAREIRARSAPGSTVDVAVAPVGERWEANYRAADPIRLHQPDDSHPTYAGSYLAALVISSTAVGISPEAVGWSGSLTESEARRLRSIAARPATR
jgi:hypothetical protein